MNKRWVILSIIFVAAVLLASYAPRPHVKITSPIPVDFSNEAELNKLPTSSVTLRIDQISERPGDRPDLGLNETREFYVYLDRPDLELKQPTQTTGDVYTDSLPLALQPRLALMSEVADRARSNGNACNVNGTFPIQCTLDLYGAETGKAKTVLMKIVFADNTYAEKEITIPYAGKLDEPTILEPKMAPQEGDHFQITFKDVGATQYDVGISICQPYGGHGINPCLHGVRYTLARDGGSVTWQQQSGQRVTPVVTIANGAVEVRLPLTFVFAAGDISVDYGVDATLEGKTGDGITTILESSVASR